MVVGSDLEGGVSCPKLTCALQQLPKEGEPKPLPPSPRVCGDHSDVEFIDHKPAAGHGKESMVFQKAKAQSAGIHQFPFPLTFTPEPTEGFPIEGNTSLQPIEIQPDHPHH